MASKMAKAVMTGTHTAGIYSDMTVDGPEIGTLVVVVDRAKNLPNRKTMGKQDPYCAARLGKEAKKTETDKRGGQTPRWDQELRFTVHDSLDYHQLKVSVFNDDKKTDLIGETWISLEDVVIPGGGKNDLWHSLNCKGRYAGDVRIELTFYDTRPKEEKPADVQAPSPVILNQDKAQDAVGGPRQPKPVRRRPLPADPTSTDSSPLRPTMPEHSQSSPLPYTPPRSSQRANNTPINYAPGPIDHGNSLDRQSPQYGYDAQASSSAYSPYNPESYDTPGSRDYSRETSHPPQQEQYPMSGSDDYVADVDYSHRPERHHDADYSENRSQYQVDYQDSSSYPSPSTQNSQYNEYQTLDLPQIPSYQPRLPRPSVQPVTSQSVHGISHSSPAATLPQVRPMPDTRHQCQFQVEDSRPSGQSYTARNIYDSSPLRHQSIESGYNSEPLSPEPFMAEDGPPPPPPAHRSNGLRSLAQHEGQDSRQVYPQAVAPAPLSVRHGRGNSSANAYLPYGNDPVLDERTLSASPSNTQLSIHSAPSISSHTSYSQPGRRQSQGTVAFQQDDRYVHSTPPSLVPGYDPSIAEKESERIIHEKRMSVRPPQNYVPLPSHDRSPVYDHQARQRPLPQYQAVTKSLAQDEYSTSNKTHSPSLAMIKTKAISPDPRTPIRKSVSPQPSFDDQKKVSPIPFSPDSYEAFNPNLKSASSVNKTPSQYNTPERMKDSPNPHPQDEKLLDEGPIIGSDGRVIDPSDHLPTESWAPEPERKPPRKGPEITFRFRNSPQGAQPMPNAAPRPPRETVIRPQSISTTVHSYSTSDISPIAATRNRLQKSQARASYVQPASSPIVPTLPPANSNSNPTTPYPLREHVNFGYGSSPTYARGSPGAPPPVPAKVLEGRGQEEWGTDALSEELKRIDIGVGGGSGGRARRRFEG